MQAQYVAKTRVEYLVNNLKKSSGLKWDYLLGQISLLYQFDLISDEEFTELYKHFEERTSNVE